MPLVKNITNRRRGLSTLNGYVEFAPFEEKDVEATAADLKANDGLFEGKATSRKPSDATKPLEEKTQQIDHIGGEPEPDAYDGMTDDALRDLIEDRDGKRPHHNTSRGKLLEAARKEG